MSHERREIIRYRGIHELAALNQTDVVWKELRALWAEHDAMERQRAGGKLPLCGDLLTANDAYHANEDKRDDDS